MKRRVFVEARSHDKGWTPHMTAAVRSGIPPTVVSWRIRNGWPVNKLSATTLEDL